MRTAVFGRERQLSRIRELLDAAAAGAGCVFVSSEESDVGRSRLVEKFERIAGRADEAHGPAATLSRPGPPAPR